MRTFRCATLIALFAFWLPAAGAQIAAPRIEAILGALQPATQVAGRTYPGRPLAELMRQYRVPAVSIAYVEGGQIVFARAYGLADTEAGRAATVETLFQAASISKPIAATGTLVLVEQGRLALDRPANAQLSAWHIPDNDFTRAAPVTLRHLLTHTAGLSVHGFLGYEAGAPLPNVIQILKGAPPANSAPILVDQLPGSAWRYSGGGFMIVQELMIEAGNRPFPELMRQLVLGPAGMTQSLYGALNPDAAASAATGYRGDGSAIIGRFHLYPELAAAGLWTTPTDLAHWAIALSRAYRGGAGGPISPASAQAMLTPGLGQWGLGVHVDGTGPAMSFDHGGANEGFRALVRYFPARDTGIVVMTNGDDGSQVFDAIVQAVGRANGWPNSAPRTIVAAQVPRQKLRDAVGRYAVAGVVAEVTLDGDRLMLSFQGDPPSELVPLRDDVYSLIDTGFELSFHRDATGRRVTSASGGGVTLPRER